MGEGTIGTCMVYHSGIHTCAWSYRCN